MLGNGWEDLHRVAHPEQVPLSLIVTVFAARGGELLRRCPRLAMSDSTCCVRAGFNSANRKKVLSPS